MNTNNTSTDPFLVKKYSVEDKPSWNDFIATAKNSTFLFYRDFMDYHSYKFKDYSLLIYKNEKLVAVLPANISEEQLHSHQGLTYGGLVLAKNITFEDVLQAFKAVLTFLKTEGVEVLNLKLLPTIYQQLPSSEIDYLLFTTKARLSRRDISSCIENRNRLQIKSSNRLRGIKKAVKNKLQFREEKNFKSFWEEVLSPNLLATHNQKPVHSLEEIELLHARFPLNIRQFNVYKEDRVIGGVTIFETVTVAHAQYISANEEGRQLAALDFLFSNLLEVFKDKKYFDFGIVNEMQGTKINKGLLHWKETFGGRSIVHDFYEIKTENHHLLNNIFI